MPLTGGVKSGIAVTPAVLFLLSDFARFEHSRNLSPCTQHLMKLRRIFAVANIHTEMHFPVAFTDLQAVSVLQSEQGVHQPYVGIDVWHRQRMRRDINGVCQRCSQSPSAFFANPGSFFFLINQIISALLGYPSCILIHYETDKFFLSHPQYIRSIF